MASTGFEGKFLGGGRRENYASDSEEEEDFKDALDGTLKPAEDGLPQVWSGLGVENVIHCQSSRATLSHRSCD